MSVPSLVSADPFAPPAELSPGAAQAEAGRREVNLLALAWRSRWLILLFMILGGGVGWLLMERATPLYTSGSDIYVERSLPRVFDSDMGVVYSNSYLNQQAGVISSTDVIAGAVKSLEADNLETFRDADSPVGLIREALKVWVGATDEIIHIAIEIPSREDAPRIVNAIVDAYISKYAEDQQSKSVELLGVLRSEKQRRGEEMEVQRQALEKFRGEHPELAVQVRNNDIVSDRFSKLTDELNQTEIELLEAKALNSRVQRMFESPALRPLLADMAREMNGDRLEEQSLLALQNQIQSVEMQIAAEKSQWGPGHPRVKLLTDSLETWQERLDEKSKIISEDRATMIAAYVDSVKQQYELLEHKYAELQRSYDRQFAEAKSVSAQALKLASLEEAIERSERDYESIDEQIKKLDITDDLGSMKVNILEVAGLPADPSYPQRGRFLGAGAMLGALMGFGMGWLRNLLDHRLKSADEIAEALQLPVLGTLPLAPGVRDRADSGLILINSPRSPLSEAIRTLRTSFHFGLGGEEAKVICITSPSPGDGKSTVTSNFAIAMAQAGRRVLLIDADMRKPRQHVIFGKTAEIGLATVLADRRPFEEAIQSTEVERLSLLPCGPTPSQPVELLNNGYFGELITQLSEHYDRIVIDSPPVLPVADARVIAAMSDATLMVLRAERATRRLSQGARNELWQVRAKRLGVVVNGVPLRKPGGYDYGYGYGGYSGYSETGYGDHADAGSTLPPSRRKKSRARLTAEPVAGAQSE